jgi:broad specificity phosphatase PhoE
VRRLLLVRHAATPAVRRAAFPRDESLDTGGRTEAGTLAERLGRLGECLASPARRTLETAAAAGLDPLVEPALAECDFGAWAGRSLAEVHADDPDAVAAWMSDPRFAAHGGESLATLADRVAGWLAEQASLDGRAAAITHGGVVRTAVIAALGAPLESFWRIDAAPLGITELHAHDGSWRLVTLNERPRGEVAHPTPMPATAEAPA